MRKSINIILKKKILIILLMISMCPVFGFSYARFVINTDSYRSNGMYMAELLYIVKIDDVSTYTLTLEAGAYEEEHIIEISSLNAVITSKIVNFQIHNGSYIKGASPTLELNKIYNVSGSYNSALMKIYVNGSLTNTKSTTGTITVPSSSTILAIGANPSGSGGSNAAGGYFGGKIYSIRLYKDELTESEVLQNYNIDKSRFNIN